MSSGVAGVEPGDVGETATATAIATAAGIRGTAG